MKVFIDFALIPLKIKCYSILQKHRSRMLDISNCDVIYDVIYVICSHFVGKAISPLFAWPGSLGFVITLITRQRKPLIICRQRDRQMDIVNPEFYFRFNFDDTCRYALLWMPNAYSDIAMHIFTPRLFFQCIFSDFQCVITLLRALSVALLLFNCCWMA